MRVIVNGEQREISSARIDALLGELEYEGTHFAIALNFDVRSKSRHPHHWDTIVAAVLIGDHEVAALGVPGLRRHAHGSKHATPDHTSVSGTCLRDHACHRAAGCASRALRRASL